MAIREVIPEYHRIDWEPGVNDEAVRDWIEDHMASEQNNAVWTWETGTIHGRPALIGNFIDDDQNTGEYHITDEWPALAYGPIYNGNRAWSENNIMRGLVTAMNARFAEE